MKDILRIQNLSLKRNGNPILQEINFSVKTGEIYGILGPNGAGKSTLAYTIMGCNGYNPDKGRILFQGEEITNFSIWQRARKGITLAWQEPARFEGITVEEYLSLGMKGKNRSEIEEALQKVLLSPKEYLRRKVDKNLSGGERKRIELAAIFTMKPQLAILDEPDSGIDILALERIVEFIYELREKGTTVILITHRPDVAKVSERAALIGEGYLVKEGDSQEVVEYFKNKCLFCPKFR
ncbi:ABC transporter ATP-binding protein [Candidatus Calescamantes bacterium]|nr:ABC transporter ATP-binding protein [Candidatus Calescamantes bacterium]